MRIIAGSAGGRHITAPTSGARPTSDRVRESVFDILDARVEIAGAVVLDLYAGSGALAIEALSRGASRAATVDSDHRAAAVIGDNMTRAGLQGDRMRILRRTVEATLAAPAPDRFDLVFCDPPYDVATGVVDAHLRELAAGDWLSPHAVVVVERGARTPECTWSTGYTVLVNRRYGDTRVEVARVDGPPSGAAAERM